MKETRKNWLILFFALCFSVVTYLTIRYSAWAPTTYLLQAVLYLAVIVTMDVTTGWLFAIFSTIAGVGAFVALEGETSGFWILGELAMIWMLAVWASQMTLRHQRLAQDLHHKTEQAGRTLADVYRDISSYRSRIGHIEAQADLRNRLAKGAALIGKSLNTADIQQGLKEAVWLNFPDLKVEVVWHNGDNAPAPDPFELWVREHRRPLLVADTSMDERFRHYIAQAGATGDCRSLAILPLKESASSARLGLLKVHASKAGRLSQEDIRVLDLYCLLANLAFENASLHQKVEDLAMHDSLTGIFARRVFDERLIQECTHASRYHLALSLSIIDIDHFKSFNDRYGHQVGDRLLVWMTQLLKESLRGVDFLARYGGEEFVVIFPETSKERAAEAMEEIRRKTESGAFAAMAQETAGVTISVGVASFPDETTSPHQLLRAADERLYLAKGSGRNRVVSY